MHRSRATRARKGEIARVAPALGQRETNRLRHVFRADRNDTLRSRDWLQPYSFTDLGDGPMRSFAVELHFAAESRLQPAQQEIGVRDGRVTGSFAIAGRSRIR